MTSIGSPSPFFLAGKKAYEIDRSLRFNRDDNAYLSRTPSSAGNRKTFTYSAWVKLGRTGVNSSTNPGNGLFLSCGPAGTGTNMALRITNSGYIGVDYYGIGGYYSSSILKDPSAWYHCVWVMDTTESTAANRFRVYVNGDLIYNNQISLSQNADTPFNNNLLTTIGAYSYSTSNAYRLDAYLAEVHFLDGYAYDPSYFAETNSTTGQWIPKKYTGNYGTNGFYLNFSNNSGTTATTLGKDESGNGNNFTPNNFSVSASAGNDSVTDTPTNNFCTFNPLDSHSNITLSNGNLTASISSGFKLQKSTFFLQSGKWYWEITCDDVFPAGFLGISDSTDSTNSQGGASSSSCMIRTNNGDKRIGGSESSYGSGISDGDVMIFALDMDNGKFWAGKNGTFFNSGNPATGSNAATSNVTNPVTPSLGMYDNEDYTANFGQIKMDSTSYADANGHGAFKYSVPSGYFALCSANLPDPTIKLPNKHFDTLLYTGNNGTQNITGLNFDPDWVWAKNRQDAGYHHDLYDAVRGDNLRLFSSQTSAEATGYLQFGVTGGFSLTSGGGINNNGSNHVAWNWNAGDTDGKTYTVKVHDFSGNNRYIFDDFQTQAVTLDLAEGGTYIFNMDDSSNASHPFSIGTAANGTVYAYGITYFLDGVSKTYNEYTSGFAAATTRRLHITVPASAPVLYYWCSVHSGMGGQINTNTTLGSSNFDGTIQATVKANATAGFSIVSYTGNGTSGARIGHGLGAYPTFTIVKNRDSSTNWPAINFPLQIAGQLNTNQVFSLGNFIAYFGGALAEPTYIQLGTHGTTNTNSDDYIAYVFSEVAGYSKFGSYTGNGSSDGPFVFTGFRPAWIMIKISGYTGNWIIFDNKRDPLNYCDTRLFANLANADTGSYNVISMLSNGFKFHNQYDGSWNRNNTQFIYLAFAESPFKYARAR